MDLNSPQTGWRSLCFGSKYQRNRTLKFIICVLTGACIKRKHREYFPQDVVVSPKPLLTTTFSCSFSFSIFRTLISRLNNAMKVKVIDFLGNGTAIEKLGPGTHQQHQTQAKSWERPNPRSVHTQATLQQVGACGKLK